MSSHSTNLSETVVKLRQIKCSSTGQGHGPLVHLLRGIKRVEAGPRSGGYEKRFPDGIIDGCIINIITEQEADCRPRDRGDVRSIILIILALRHGVPVLLSSLSAPSVLATTPGNRTRTSHGQ